MIIDLINNILIKLFCCDTDFRSSSLRKRKSLIDHIDKIFRRQFSRLFHRRNVVNKKFLISRTIRLSKATTEETIGNLTAAIKNSFIKDLLASDFFYELLLPEYFE